MLATLVTARALGPTGRGQIAVLTAVASYAVVGWSLSLETGILSFGRGDGIPNHLSRSLRVPLRVLVVFSSITILGVGGILTAGGLPYPVLLVFAVGSGISVAVAPVTAIERLRGRHHSATWWPAIVVVAQQLGGLIALLISPQVESYLVFSSAAGMVATVTFLVLSRADRTDTIAKALAPILPIRKVITYSLSGHSGVLLHLLCMRFPIIVAGAYLGDAEAGVLSIAFAVSEVSLLVSQSQLGWVLQMATREPHNFAPLRMQLRICAVLTGGCCVALLAVSLWIPDVLGAGFESSRSIMLAIVPGMIGLGMWRLAAYDLAARGFAGLRTTSAACGAAVSVLGGIAALASHSVHILAWATSSSYWVMAICLYVGFRRRRS